MPRLLSLASGFIGFISAYFYDVVSPHEQAGEKDRNELPGPSPAYGPPLDSALRQPATGTIARRLIPPGTAIRVKLSAGIGVNLHCPCFFMR